MQTSCGKRTNDPHDTEAKNCEEDRLSGGSGTSQFPALAIWELSPTVRRHKSDPQG